MAAGFGAPTFFPIPSSGVVDASIPQLKNAQLVNVPSDLKEAKLHSWNVAFQRQLPWNLVGEVAYVGNVGKGIVVRGWNINAGMVLGAENAGRPLFAQYGRTANVRSLLRRRHVLQLVAGQARPALQERLPGHDLVHPQPGGELRGRGRHRDAGRHRAELRARRASTARTRSRPPSSGTCRSSRRTTAPCTGSSAAGSSAGSSPRTPGPRSTSRLPPPRSAPRATPSTRTSAASRRSSATSGPGQKYFDTSAFSAPAQNTWGTLTRNGSISGPGFWNLDASLVKRLTVRPEGQRGAAGGRLQPDQHAALQQPERLLRPATFGEINSSFGQRLVRFGLRVIF